MNPIEGFWCEAVVWAPTDGGRWPLGGTGVSEPPGYIASTPRLAIRWLERQAHRIANALYPDADCPFPTNTLVDTNPCAPNPGAILRAWTRDWDAQGRHMAVLGNGRPISITAGDLDRVMNMKFVEVSYSLSATPITVDFARGWKKRGDISSALSDPIEDPQSNRLPRPIGMV